jgi:hypothetical protein
MQILATPRIKERIKKMREEVLGSSATSLAEEDHALQEADISQVQQERKRANERDL